MSDRVSIADLKARINIVRVVEKYVALKPQGHEFVGLCCFHDDKNASLKVNEQKQIFSCFACGAKGDVVDFLTRQGKTINEAIQELQGIEGNTMVPKKKTEEWKQTTSKEDIAFQIKLTPEQCKFFHVPEANAIPSAVWKYTNLDGELIGFTCRFETPTGKKILPYTLRTNGKHTRWMWKGFDKPNPLYNQKVLRLHLEKPVLIVEGEKVADAAAKIFPEYNVITWMGGADRWQNAFWTVIKGFDTVCWPDADQQRHPAGHALAGQLKPYEEQPGVKAMHGVSAILSKTQRVRIVRVTFDFPAGWDLADCTEPVKARNYMNKNLYEFKMQTV